MDPATAKLLQALEQRLAAEISKVDAQIIASRKLRKGPTYDPEHELGMAVRRLDEARFVSSVEKHPSDAVATKPKPSRTAESVSRELPKQRGDDEAAVVTDVVHPPELDGTHGQSQTVVCAVDQIHHAASSSDVTSAAAPPGETTAQQCLNDDAAATVSSSVSAPRLTSQQRVEALYRAYDLAKLPKVPALLQKYEGSEEALISALVAKYGPEPGTPCPSPQPREHQHEMHGDDDAATRHGYDQSTLTPANDCIERQDSTTTAQSSNPDGDYRRRIEALYQAYDPAKLGKVPGLLQKYEGSEDTLLAALVAKYGPEPSTAAEQQPHHDAHECDRTTDAERLADEAEEDAAAARKAEEEAEAARKAEEAAESEAPGSCCRTPESIEERIMVMFEAHAPRRLATLEATMAKFRGTEEAVISALVAKYGPEPAGTEAAKLLASAEERIRAGNVNAVPPRGTSESASPVRAGSADSITKDSEALADPALAARIRCMYKVYAPEKLPTVDMVLAKYAGNEQALLSALVQKYGPEPSTSGQAVATTPDKTGTDATAVAGGSASVTDRIRRMYEVYAPEKVCKLDALLGKYSGNEQALLSALVQKYGPEPDQAPASPVIESTPVPEQPAAAAAADSPAPAAPPVTPQQRVRRMYEVYAPDKLERLDAMLSKYSGNEEALLSALVQKYGPEPDGGGPPEPVAAATPRTPGSTASTSGSPRAGGGNGNYRKRIEAIFNAYAPHRLDTIDAMLSKYKGNEETVIEALVSKYGAEPEAEASEHSQPHTASDAEPPSASRSRQLTPRNLTPRLGTPRTPRAGTAAAPRLSPEEYRERIMAIYRAHAPDKLDKVDGILLKYEGSEDSLLTALMAKYGVTADGQRETDGASDTDGMSSSTNAAPPQDPTTLVKSGMLMNYGKKSLFRSFKRQFVVVTSERLSWYKSADEYRAKPDAPIDFIPLYVISKNSRGSNFKNPAVCYPVVTTKDCPKATDPKMCYFGVQYNEPNGDHPVLTLATDQPQERDEWVHFITTFIRLYVPHGVENAGALAQMAVGADPPLHLKEAWGGEAPGSKDPTPVRTK